MIRQGVKWHLERAGSKNGKGWEKAGMGEVTGHLWSEFHLDSY